MDRWYIHQRLLYQSLGFPKSKIPLDLEKTFVDFEIPTGIRYEVDMSQGAPHKYTYARTGTQIATVIVKAKQARYMDKYDYRSNKMKRVRVHDAKQRVFIVCPNCGRHVPFSRMKQHYGKKTCTK